MDYNGKEVKTLKELEDVIVKEANIRDLLDKLDNAPKQIKTIVEEQRTNLGKLRELIDLAEQLSDPTTKDNLLAVTREMYPAMATTEAEAELILKQNKKGIIKRAKEMAMDGVELIKHIRSFYENIIKVDIFGTEKEGRKIAAKIKKFLTNGDIKTGMKKMGVSLALSIALATISSLLLGFPIGSIEHFAFAGGASAAAGAITAKKSRERINGLVKKITKK